MLILLSVVVKPKTGDAAQEMNAAISRLEIATYSQ